MRDLNYYQNLIDTYEPTTDISKTLKKLRALEHKYKDPWYYFAAIHYRESDNDFQKQLLNGQPWNKVTTIVPIGRGPWASFEDALAELNAPDTIPEMLQAMEAHNGWGYAKKGLNSPYLWGGSNHLQLGRYTSDGKFDPNSLDKRLGAATILLELSPLRFNERSNRVRKLQEFLNRQGFDLKVDGHFGDQTYKAYIRYFP